jgi:hypothetical protein
MQIPIEPAAWRYKSRRVGFEQLDDGIGCIVVRTVLEKPWGKCFSRGKHYLGG